MRSFLKLVRSVAWFSRAGLVLGAVGVACSGRSVDPTPKGCNKDADCGGGQRCDVAIDRPAIGMAPCATAQLCSDDAQCPSGGVCAPSWQLLPNYPYCGDMLCAPPCVDSSCPPYAECGSDGLCRLTACDAPGAEPCPNLWRCDPEAAATAPHDVLEGTTVSDPALDIDRNMARGCVRKKCDEPGGYECAAAWSCKPESTTNVAGCIPEDCRDTGHCSDDTYLVCLTEAKHQDHGPLDVNSCVPRTCDDGFSCAHTTEAGVDVARCQYGAANADYYGCVLLPCTNDDECFYGYRCDHSSAQSDERGCRLPSCTEGYMCPEGFVCDPTAREHDAADCTIPGSANTGGTGMGGSAGTAAGGTGSGGLGGSVGNAPPRGHCVAR